MISNATNQLRIVLSNLEEENDFDSTSTPTVSESTNQVQRNILPHLQFVINQLENLLVPKNHRRYNLITLVLALKCQLISPACYRYLQSLDCVSLPHHSTLQRLYSNIGLDSEFTRFLQQSTVDFNYMERCVIIQMDEVHVKSEYTYKGGKIIGASMQPDYPAKTVFAIMVSSLCKKWSTIVRLIPCSSSSAKELFPIIKSVINDIENCNLTVEAIGTDNYPMNVSLFKLFSPTGILEVIIAHPFNSNRSIVLLFDFVHILKSIRNNWLYQHDYNRTFLYPNFEDLMQVNRALFEDIRLLYRSEQNSVAKLAHRLTAKSCWPSNLERQSVSLAHRVFNESTAAALTIQDYSRLKFKTNTADFVTIISNIWKIFNINTPNKGIRLNDELSHPLVNNDSRFQYLGRIVDWLDQWKTFPEKSGKFTTQTFTSLRHSCLALPKIVTI